MTSAIKVEGLSKLYRIGATPMEEYQTFRESIVEAVSKPVNGIRRWMSGQRQDPDQSTGGGDELWALQDISFNVKAGEVLGVVGRNGAGKSTLLKIFSRITQPSKGRVELRGRVGSLLEVGTGFHPELTGRENVFLNGAILGMGRKEIARKFDEIVAFAEIERFLDTPVKRYSSGMYTRLAFAVASHLEPEILIVDEVLAVGDSAFQKKCLGRMNEVSRDGRTVLFVSHNMNAVKSLCDRAILLDKGRVILDGDVDDVVDGYLNDGQEADKSGDLADNVPRHRDIHGVGSFRKVWISDLDDVPKSFLHYRQPFRVHFVCDVMRDIPDGHFEISISTVDSTHVTYSTTMMHGNKMSQHISAGRHVVAADFDVELLPRPYTIDLGLHFNDGTTVDLVQHALSFPVLRAGQGETKPYPWQRTRGLVGMPANWRAAEVLPIPSIEVTR